MRCSLATLELVIATLRTVVSVIPYRLFYSFTIYYYISKTFICFKQFHLASTLPSFSNLHLAEEVLAIDENEYSSSFTDSEREFENIPQPHESQLNLATCGQPCTPNPETIHGFVPQVPQNPWTVNPPTAMSGWNPSFGWENTQGGGAGAPTPPAVSGPYPGKENPSRQTS